MIDNPCAEARRIFSSIERTLPACYVCPRHGTKFCVDTRFWHARWDTTIIMTAHNNDNILIVHYEDIPDEDRDTINKSTEEFQKKCLLSYTKMRDSTIIQKFPLPRVLLQGQTDTVKAKERCFFTEAIDKSVRDALSSRNEAFIDVFHNAMKEAIHGILVSQVGSTCYNILDLLTQGTNQVGTSHQEAALAGNGEVQALQGSFEQTLGASMNQIQYNPRPSIQHMQ